MSPSASSSRSASRTSGLPRRAAVIGGNRIPFARQNGAYAKASNQDMLTAAIEGLVARHGLAGEQVGEVAAGAVLKHARDFNLTRESVLGSSLSADAPLPTTCSRPAAPDSRRRSWSATRSPWARSSPASRVAPTPRPTRRSPSTRACARRCCALNRAKTPGQRAKALAGLRPSQLVPEIPRNVEPRTGLSMGEHMAQTAKQWGISREAQDEIAAASHQQPRRRLRPRLLRRPDDAVPRARRATRTCAPTPRVEKLATLKPVFGKGEGATMTAGNSTPLTDGASAVLLGSDEWAAGARAARARAPRRRRRPPPSTT